MGQQADQRPMHLTIRQFVDVDVDDGTDHRFEVGDGRVHTDHHIEHTFANATPTQEFLSSETHLHRRQRTATTWHAQLLDDRRHGGCKLAQVAHLEHAVAQLPILRQRRVRIVPIGGRLGIEPVQPPAPVADHAQALDA